eukprot:1358123-Amorphochlora_amoeboformis.AAC.2
MVESVNRCVKRAERGLTWTYGDDVEEGVDMDVEEKPKEAKAPKKNLKGDYSEEVKVKIPEFLAPVEKDVLAHSHVSFFYSELTALYSGVKYLHSADESPAAREENSIGRIIAADTPSTQKLAKAIIDVCVECKRWSLLNSHIAILCKRRAQLRKVISTVVQTGMAAIDQTPDKKTKTELIETLRTVSAGKVYNNAVVTLRNAERLVAAYGGARKGQVDQDTG